MISLKSKNEIQTMQSAADVLKEVFRSVEEAIEPGITTDHLDQIAEKIILKRGAIPAFKGYRGFPKTACISVNEQVVHGIPGERVLQEGDIVSFDIGAIVEKFYADAARTWPVGKVSKETMKLIQAAKDSFDAGVEAYKPGARIGDLSHAIQECIEEAGFGIVKDYVGHGIGKNLHEDPQVPNYGASGQGPKIQEGLVLAIEPMLTAGSAKVQVDDDGWTVVTADRQYASHYEETVAFIDGSYKILTR